MPTISTMIGAWPPPGADETLCIAGLFRTPQHIDFGIVRHGSGDVLPGSYDSPTVP